MRLQLAGSITTLLATTFLFANACSEEGVETYTLNQDASIHDGARTPADSSPEADSRSSDAAGEANTPDVTADSPNTLEASEASEASMTTDASDDHSIDLRDAGSDSSRDAAADAAESGDAGNGHDASTDAGNEARTDAGDSGHDATDLRDSGDAAAQSVKWAIAPSVACEAPAKVVACGVELGLAGTYGVLIDTTLASCAPGSPAFAHIRFPPKAAPDSGEFAVIPAVADQAVPAGKVTIEFELSGSGSQWVAESGKVVVKRAGGRLFVDFTNVSVTGASATTASGSFVCP